MSSNYPTGFSDLVTIGQVADGYTLWSGFPADYVDKLQPLIRQPSIREYCPKDLSERFTDIDAAQAWLSKGRAMYWLLRDEDQTIAGYGWAGPGTTDHVPGGATTLAVRLNEVFQGQGLALPFCQALLAAAEANYDAADWWLESWQSNGGAIHIYEKLHFKLVIKESAQRASVNGISVDDKRLYMNR